MKYLIPIILAVLIGLVLFVDCRPKPVCGTVKAKWVDPAHRETRTSFIMCGKLLMPMTRTVDVPTRYWLLLSDSGYVEVDEPTYLRLKVGDIIGAEQTP